ncbi:bifunctional metallophosphatase/5'-nucleotidase [Flaviflexus equikiangi]|nr:5'-nucleotidase C-terminal domain-containing protein [Flaviflexus equikiangi]
MRNHLLGARRPLAVTATVALVAMGIAAPATAAPAGDDSDKTAVVEPQNTNTETVTIDVVGITDFHGYIETAPYLKTQIDAVRAANENTVFVSAGDNIGGSAYVSAIAQDVPTLNVLNAMGLDVSAVGNHEFDQGYADLTDRVIPLIDFSYLGANVGGADEINTPPYEVVDIDGVSVAFVGSVTETTPTIVVPDGIAGLTFADPVATTNDVAAQLKDGNPANGEADVVVSLFHEGDSVAKGLSGDVDLVFAGHTHISSNVMTDAGAPILQGGQYGQKFAHATLSVSAEGVVTIDDTKIVDLDKSVAADPEIQALVDAAKAEAEVLGAEVLAEITENAFRGTNTGSDMGSNRGTESSMGNHVANAALMTANKLSGADFGLTNPGGLRNDLDSLPAGGDGKVTYGEAFSAQPFGNTIGTIDLTGEQVYTVLEQQFQPGASRPVLRLGLSDNVTYTYDWTAEDGGDITGVWIDGVPVDKAATYTVASNTFLLTGQDGFTEFAQGTNPVETGIVDLQAYVDYIKAGNADTIPAGQRSIGLIHDPLVAGASAEVELASLVFTALEEKPDTVTVYLNGVEVGSSAIDATIVPNRDDTGTAAVTVAVPADVPAASELRIVTTFANGDVDTDVTIPVKVAGGSVTIDVVGITDFHGYIETAPYLKTQIDAVRAANENTVFVSAGDNIGGSAYVSAIAQDVPTLNVLNAMGLDVSAVGNHEFDQGYADLTDRVIPLIDFSYLGANVGGADEINTPPYEVVDIDGVSVAFVGSVTETTPTIVVPDGIAGLTFADPVATTNDVAAQLKDGNPANGEADVVVSLFHEGDSVAKGLSGDVDLVFAGHTHISSNVMTDAGAPILQGGQYGQKFAHATLSVSAEGVVTIDDTKIVDLDKSVAADPEIQALVDAAKAEAEVLGAEVLAEITENAFRGTNTGSDMGSNRGTESSMGNHVANAALMTANKLSGADFGLTNPGGLRNDLDSLPAGGDGKVTYGEAFSAQPFGNTIGTIDLTGEQVYTVLEQQFQPGASRPVLRLGLSDNVTYTYDWTAEDGGDITGVWIDGVPVDKAATYTVASNTFLLTGQDGFTEFAQGTNPVETGIVDLQAYVDYIKAGNADTIPAGQRSIGLIHDPLVAGASAEVELASLVFTALEEKPDTVTVYLNGVEVGSSAIDATIVPNRDDTGTAAVTVAVPADVPAASELRIVTTFANGDVDTDVTIPVSAKIAPSVGNWFYVSNDWTSTVAAIEFGFGRAGDEVFAGDWDNDGKDTFAVRRGTTFYVTNELKGGDAEVEFRYGRLGDEVIVGDWDGDGYDTFGVRRGNTFYLNNELKGGAADLQFNYGRRGDEILTGDWDNDTKDTITVRRGNAFFVNNELVGGAASHEFNYGRATDKAFAGDYNGNGYDTISLRRGNVFIINNDLVGGFAGSSLGFGRVGDDVFIGDWDGDMVDTPAVRR